VKRQSLDRNGSDFDVRVSGIPFEDRLLVPCAVHCAEAIAGLHGRDGPPLLAPEYQGSDHVLQDRYMRPSAQRRNQKMRLTLLTPSTRNPIRGTARRE
jgi:hypothetical protein